MLLAACGNDVEVVLDASPGGGPLDVLSVDAPIDAPPEPVAVTLTLLRPPLDPAAVQLVVAYQDGDGTWTRAPAPVGDDYTFTIASGRYGVMVACMNDQLGAPRPARFVQLEYFTVAETARVTMSSYRCGLPPTANVHGNVANAISSIAISSDGFYGDGWSTYSLPARRGLLDVVATDPPYGPTYASTRLLIVHDVDVVGNTRIDLDVADALPTTEHQVIGIVAAPGEQLRTSSALRTANGTDVGLSHASSTMFRASPVATRAPGDRDHVSVSIGTSNRSRTLTRWGGPPGDIVGSLPAPLTAVQCTTDGATPYPRVLATWGATDADRVHIHLLQPSPAGLGLGDLLLGAARSRGHLAGATSWSLPDFSTISDWPAVYQPTPGSATSCAVTAYQTAAGPSAFASLYPPDGTTVRSATADTVWTP